MVNEFLTLSDGSKPTNVNWLLNSILPIQELPTQVGAAEAAKRRIKPAQLCDKFLF